MYLLSLLGMGYDCSLWAWICTVDYLGGRTSSALLHGPEARQVD